MDIHVHARSRGTRKIPNGKTQGFKEEVLKIKTKTANNCSDEDVSSALLLENLIFRLYIW